jgi:hypothetical protein
MGLRKLEWKCWNRRLGMGSFLRQSDTVFLHFSLIDKAFAVFQNGFVWQKRLYNAKAQRRGGRVSIWNVRIYLCFESGVAALLNNIRIGIRFRELEPPPKRKRQ